MKKGVTYALKIDNQLSTAGSSVVYQDIECLDIRANGIYVVKFMFREWVGPLNQLTNPKSSIKLSINPKEFLVTCNHSDKKKTVYRWDTKPSEVKSAEDNPIEYSTFSTNSFNVDKYTTDLFTHKTDTQAETHLNYLNERKLGCIDHLKKDVYKNHLIFIGASKEIANSEVDMLDFRNLITDYGNCITSLQNLSIHWDHYKVKKNNKNEFESLSSTTEPIQWLTTAPNELRVAVQQREFENAVALVEKINQIYENNPKVEITMQTHSLKDSIENNIKNLTDKLMDELRSPLLKPNQIKETISLLVRLSQNDKAKSIFLESRSHSISQSIKKVPVSGDLNRYISELVRIIFNSIIATCNDFTNSFPSHMNSGLISWVIEEMVLISDIFQRQVFILDNFYAIAQTMRIVESHCEMMDTTGLSINFYWKLLLQPHLEQVITHYELKIRSQTRQHLGEEKFIGISKWDYEIQVTSPTMKQENTPSKNTPYLSPAQKAVFEAQQLQQQQLHENDDSKLKLTESTIFLNTVTQRFANDICQIISIDSIPVVSVSLSKIFRDYMTHLLAQMEKGTLSDSQCLSIISNSIFIVDDLVLRIANKFEDALGEKLNNLKNLSEELTYLHERIRDEYAIQKARDIIGENVMNWDEEDYRIEEEIEAFPKKFIKLSDHLDTLANTIQMNVNSETVLPIISRIISEVVVLISQRLQSNPLVFGYGGLQHFVLEMKYLTTFAGKYPVEDFTFGLISDLIDKNVDLFASTNHFDSSTVLKPDEYFTSIIDNLVYQKAVYQ